MPHEPPTEPGGPNPRRHSWLKGFVFALRGMRVTAREERNFRVHLLAAAAVVAAGVVLGVSAVEWCLLALCIALVLAAELFNTALERLARAVTREENPHVRDALDAASGAVLMVAVGAAMVGVMVLGRAAWAWLG